MRKIALLGAAGIIGVSGAAVAQTDPIDVPPVKTTPSVTGAPDRLPPARATKPGESTSGSRTRSGRHRPKAVESLGAEAGTVSGSGETRRKFVRSDDIVGITNGRGVSDIAPTAGAAAGAAVSGLSSGSSSSGVTSGGGGSSSAGITSAGGSSSSGAASAATAGRAPISTGSGATSGITAGSITSGITGAGGGNSQGNSGSKGGGKGKGK